MVKLSLNPLNPKIYKKNSEKQAVNIVAYGKKTGVLKLKQLFFAARLQVVKILVGNQIVENLFNSRNH